MLLHAWDLCSWETLEETLVLNKHLVLRLFLSYDSWTLLRHMFRYNFHVDTVICLFLFFMYM